MAELRKATMRAQRGVPLAGMTRAAAPLDPTPARARRGKRPAPKELTTAERVDVIDTFLVLLEGLYTHLPLKRAMYAIDPLQRLRLLRQRAGEITDLELHNELAMTLTGLRDAHTRYVGPDWLAGRVAALPFMVEAYGPANRRRYVVSKVETASRRITDRNFVKGVEILWWNAVPIDRAVDIHALQETLGRLEARRSRALESLTFRPLQFGPPPDEHWVVIGYREPEGKQRDVRVDWRVLTPGRAAADGADGRAGRTRRAKAAARAYALDRAAETRRRAKKLLFAPTVWETESASRRRAGARAPYGSAECGEWWDTDFRDAISAKVVQTSHGRFGYLRVWTFDLDDDVAFIEEVVRILEAMPERGLVIDLRANPGGLIWAAERMLQLFTPRRVMPTRFSMVATELTRAMVEAAQNQVELEPWRQSVREAVSTGDLYSRAIPLTPPDAANDIEQVYGGPVVAVVDANTYSSGDLFAAGFVDNEIGILVSTDDATGAGGANVWQPGDVRAALANTAFEQRPLPMGIQYTLAVRRATRSGSAEGVPIEDLGVRGEPYAMTKRDLTDDNKGLLNFCGSLLADVPRSSLRVELDPAHGSRVLVHTKGLDRLDLIIDGRPREPVAVGDGRTVLTLPEGWSELRLTGYLGDELCQSRRLFA